MPCSCPTFQGGTKGEGESAGYEFFQPRKRVSALKGLSILIKTLSNEQWKLFSIKDSVKIVIDVGLVRTAGLKSKWAGAMAVKCSSSQAAIAWLQKKTEFRLFMILTIFWSYWRDTDSCGYGRRLREVSNPCWQTESRSIRDYIISSFI